MCNFVFQSEENQSSQSKHHNGVKDNIVPNPPLSPKSPSQDVLNSTGQNIATISYIDINIQPQEHKDKPRKGKPPRPSAAKGTEREEKKKEDTVVPQPHPKKQVSGVLNEKDERLLVAQSLSGAVPQKQQERAGPINDSRVSSVNMSVEEDTMKLLQQAAMEDVKTDKQDTTEAKEDQKTEAERHSGNKEVCYTL